MKAVLGLLFGVSLLVASIDINSASLKELTKLKGIGESKAKAIIEYRQKHCFKNSDELTKVKGIGKKTVKKNIEDIVVKECNKKSSK